jgi:hypothetical protein
VECRGPFAFAVLRLITSSNLVGACTGRSAGFSPLRMRLTYSAARLNTSNHDERLPTPSQRAYSFPTPAVALLRTVLLRPFDYLVGNRTTERGAGHGIAAIVNAGPDARLVGFLGERGKRSGRSARSNSGERAGRPRHIPRNWRQHSFWACAGRSSAQQARRPSRANRGRAEEET